MNNSSTNDFEKQKSFRLEKSFMNADQSEYNSKMVQMEKDISYYKEKLNKFKGITNSKHTNNQNTGIHSNEFDSNALSQAAGQSTGSFYVQSNHLYSESAFSLKQNDISTTDQFNGGLAASHKIKVSKKDLRRITDDELLKRSSSKNF